MVFCSLLMVKDWSSQTIDLESLSGVFPGSLRRESSAGVFGGREAWCRASLLLANSEGLEELDDGLPPDRMVTG